MKVLLVAHITVFLSAFLMAKVYPEDTSAMSPRAHAQIKTCDGSICDPEFGSNLSKAAEPCCSQGSVAFMRATNTISLELVSRETDDRNFAYFVDTDISLKDVGAELQTAIGDMLESSSYFHGHSVNFVVSNHKRAKGWPSSNHIAFKNNQIRSVCILSPLSHERTAIAFASQLMGTQNLPVAHRTDEFTMRFLAAPHESFHCISAHRSKLDHRAKTALETISDVGAVNEALRIGIDTEYLIALADWRALRFASGLADVVAGRVNGKSLYSRAFPSHMSTVAINRLLAKGPLDS